jgi:4-hydroxyphenylpyruvate dioxygenase
MRLALSQYCLPELSTADFLDVVERAGWDGCELGVMGGPRDPEDPKAMIAAARASDVRIESVGVLRDWALPDDPDCGPRVEVLLDVAAATGAPVITCVAPVRYEGMPAFDAVRASASERLAEFADLAAHAGVRLALEPVGLSSTSIGARGGIRTLAEALAVVEAAGPSVGLVLDSYNVATAGDRLEGVASVPCERIALAQVADGLVTGSMRKLPGEGELPLAAFIAALGRAGFDGALSLEVLPTKALPDARAFAGLALEAVRGLLPAVAA